MSGVRASTEIAAPPERVWELMCAPERYPEFAEPTDRMLEIPEGEFGLGSVYREYGGVPPFKGASTWRVMEFEPMRRQRHVGDDGFMTMDLVVEIEATPTGSRLSQHLTLKPRWYLAPVNAMLWPVMMRKRAQAAMDKTVLNVKRALEAGA